MNVVGFIDVDLSGLARDLGLVFKVLLAIVGTTLASLSVAGLIGLIASSPTTPRAPRPRRLTVRHVELWEGETYGRIDLRG